LIRQICFSTTGALFSKPRFIWEQGKLSLINAPTPDPFRLVDIMNNFPSWELAKYEHWYKPEDYRENIFLKSKLAAFIYSLFSSHYKEGSVYTKDVEDLSLKIITLFKKDVESAGSKFIVVYLPLRDDVKSMKEKKVVLNPDFFKRLEKVVPVIHTQVQLSKQASDIKTLIPDHYSSQANKIVADVIADSLTTPAGEGGASYIK
jgi:hypothetical protein